MAKKTSTLDMIPSGIEVRHFGAHCNACDGKFQVPLLSDFSHGEFIFYGRVASGYLNSIEDPAWDDIDARLRAQGLLPESPTRDLIERFQRVVASMADKLGGQRLHLHPVCAHCESKDVTYGVMNPGAYHEMPKVTFSEYSALSPEQRDRTVASGWRDAIAEPAGLDLKRALNAIFSVFRDFGFQVGDDIRLGSLGHLFERHSTRDEVDAAIEHMITMRWLAPNQAPGARLGGMVLTPSGVTAMADHARII